MNCELNSEPVFASLPIKKLSKTQRNRVSLQFTNRVFGIIYCSYFCFFSCSQSYGLIRLDDSGKDCFYNFNLFLWYVSTCSENKHSSESGVIVI